MEGIQVLDDAISYIRSRKEQFIRVYPVHGYELASNLVSDALMVSKGRVTAFRNDKWWIVASDDDWLAGQNAIDVPGMFYRIIPLPQAGQNSMRSEVLLTAFAQDVITFSPEGVSKIKGSVPEDSPIWDLIRRSDWKRIVAFTMG